MSEGWPLPAELVRRIASAWADPSELRPLSTAKNFVFAFSSADGDAILRIHAHSERDEPAIAAELDWVRTLAAAGVPVAAPLPMRDGGWVFSLPLNDGRILHSAAFRRLPGTHPEIRADRGWDPAVVAQAGALLGRMHALSHGWRPPPGTARFDWSRQNLPFLVSTVVPPEERAIHRTFRRHWARLGALSQDAGGYGLVHGDYHAGNLLQDGNALAVIDFDNCCRHWFVADVAQFLSMALLPLAVDSRAPRDPVARALFRDFMGGYLLHHRLDPRWIELLPDFLLGFDLVLYLGLRPAATAPGAADEVVAYADYLRRNIAAGRPGVRIRFVDDYRELAGLPPAPGLWTSVLHAPARLFRRLLGGG